MKEMDKYGQVVSFGCLLGEEKGLRKNEVEILSKKKSLVTKTNIFRKAFKKEFEKNINNYQAIKNLVDDNNTSVNSFKITGPDLNALSTTLADENLQVFYAYDPEYANDDQSISEFYYVSSVPLDGSVTNTVYLYLDGSQTYQAIQGIEDSFVDVNPVYIVLPIDPCDLDGGVCEFIDLEPTKIDINSGDLNLGGLDHFEFSSDGGGSSGGLDPVESPSLLTYNVNHNDILEGDLLSAYIPKIKVNGTSWMGWGGTHQKLTFYRATGDGNVTQNADGTISAGAQSYPLKDIRIPRRDVNNDHWMDFNVELDPDWKMSENTQSMAVFSIHHFGVTVSRELSTKSGFKVVGGAIVPYADVSGTDKVTITVGSAKFRANVELSRKQFLATIVGDGITYVKIPDNGIYYNVKHIGIVDYYVKYYYLDLTD